MVSDLTGLPIANASLLDEGTSASEAMILFFHSRTRQKEQAGANKFFVDADTFPQTLDVLKGRASHLGIDLVISDYKAHNIDDSFFGALVQYPNNSGQINDYTKFAADVHAAGAFVACATDLMALTLITSPAEWGADVAFGNSQRFGVPMGFGGPHAAFFASKDDFKRNLPDDFFNTCFDDEKTDSTKKTGQVVPATIATKEPILKKAKVYEYRPPKFFNDYLVSGFNNNVLVSRFQPYQGGNGPIQLSNGDPFNGILRVGTSDLFEDWKFAGGFRISPNLDNNGYVLSTQYLKKRIDYGLTYYRNTVLNPPLYDDSAFFNVRQYTNMYQESVTYPFNRIKSLRFDVAYRSDKYVKLANEFFPDQSLRGKDERQTYALAHIEYVHDDAISPATNIWFGLRWKAYMDFNARIAKTNPKGTTGGDHPTTFNFGFDARHYLPIYRNIIWAVRAAGDFSWGNEKFIYFLGGVDNWLMFGNNLRDDGTYRF